MNGLNQPQHPRNRKPRRRRRNFGGQNQSGQQGPGQGRQGGGQNRQNRANRGQRRGGGSAFVGPMDHSYRNQGNGAGGQGARFHNGAQATPNMEPLTQRQDAPTRIFAFVDDLFFVAKIQEISRKLNVKVEFVKTDKDIAEKTENVEEKPSLIIVDLNSNGIKPLPVITKMRSKYKKATSIVGFVSHVQGDLKVKAQEAGCDVVMPRSAFSQNLASILRRHGADEEIEDNFNRA
jgi:CheY-like chemotaxis protein